MKEIIGQVLGVIATLITFLSYQTNTKRSLIITQTAATTFNCISYLLLGATSGFVLNIVCIVRNVIYYFQKERSRANLVCAFGLAVLIGALGALSWQGPISLLIIIALAVNTVFLSFGRAQLLRYSILFTSTAILIYNVYVFTVGGIANESVAIISSLIGIVRFKKSGDV